jgi:hypothetical protein
MPTPMMNASVLAAPLRAHQPKGTALFLWLPLMAIMVRFLQICQRAKHSSKFVTQKL